MASVVASTVADSRSRRQQQRYRVGDSRRRRIPTSTLGPSPPRVTKGILVISEKRYGVNLIESRNIYIFKALNLIYRSVGACGVWCSGAAAATAATSKHVTASSSSSTQGTPSRSLYSLSPKSLSS